MDASDRERKRHWKAQQRTAAQAAFPLTDELMESFFQALAGAVGEHGCDHTRRFTDQWLLGHPESRERVLAWLEENGGFCDCEVDANAADHWEQNR